MPSRSGWKLPKLDMKPTRWFLSIYIFVFQITLPQCDYLLCCWLLYISLYNDEDEMGKQQYPLSRISQAGVPLYDLPIGALLYALSAPFLHSYGQLFLFGIHGSSVGATRSCLGNEQGFYHYPSLHRLMGHDQIQYWIVWYCVFYLVLILCGCPRERGLGLHKDARRPSLRAIVCWTCLPSCVGGICRSNYLEPIYSWMAIQPPSMSGTQPFRRRLPSPCNFQRKSEDS